MAFVRMTLEEARTSSDFDKAKIDATTENDIRRHMIEDGFDPDHPFAGLKPVISSAVIRVKLKMTAQDFAKALHIPVETVHAWEAEPLSDPVALSLLILIGDDPIQSLEILKTSAFIQLPEGVEAD